MKSSMSYVLTFLIRCSRDRIPVGLTVSITTDVVSSISDYGEKNSIQLYVIQFVSYFLHQ